MDEDQEGLVVSCNENQDEWFVVRREWRGDVLHREILGPRYRTTEEATEAMALMIEQSR